jgi:diacylglycerol kinase (ATP)
MVPTGTGNDFAKTLGVLTLSPTDIAQLVARGHTTPIDVGLADGHYFINTCGFGFDASVLEATQSARFLRGDAVYIYAALRQLFSYRGIEISTNGALQSGSERMLMAVASNGRSLGGAFRIAPTASVIDGKLDFCLFGDTNVLGRARRFAGALRGTHLKLPGVTAMKSESLTLTFADNPAMEMDGELIQASSRTVRIECVPKALAVYAAPGALV